MAIYQYVCSKCNRIFDRLILDMKKEYPTSQCIHCDGVATKIVSIPSKFQWSKNDKLMEKSK